MYFLLFEMKINEVMVNFIFYYYLFFMIYDVIFMVFIHMNSNALLYLYYLDITSSMVLMNYFSSMLMYIEY